MHQATFPENSIMLASAPYAVLIMMDKRTSVGEAIFTARKATGLSQAELARALNVTQQMISQLEHRSVAIRPEVLRELSRILRVPVERLLGQDEVPKPKLASVGRVRRLFDTVTQLPKRQQRKVVEVIEAIVARYETEQPRIS